MLFQKSMPSTFKNRYIILVLQNMTPNQVQLIIYLFRIPNILEKLKTKFEK